MKQRILKLSNVLAAMIVIAGMLTQSCKKSNGGPGGENPPTDPQETATLKLVPDDVFRAYLKANICPNAFDKTGKLIDITHPEVKNFAGEMLIDTVNCPSPFVSSMKGVEYFTKMTKLVVKRGLLDSLNLPNTMAIDTLRLLNAKDLQYVNVSGCTNMRYIRVADIPAVSLDLSNLPALEYINLITLKRLSELKVNNDGNLRHLMTYGLTSMKSVDVSSNPELRRLFMESSTALTSIDVTHNPKLYGVVATYSYSLKSVDLSQNPVLRFVQFDDAGIDSIDFSHNPALISVAMLRTPLRNLDFRNNPDLKLLYLDGCWALSTVDLRAQTSFDYYSINWGTFGQMGPDDALQFFQDGYVSLVPTAQHTIHAQATRKALGAPSDLFGGLRLPIFQDAGYLSLTEVKANDAIKDNYSFVMSRRVIGNSLPVRIKVYAADQTTVLCPDYDPLSFICN